MLKYCGGIFRRCLLITDIVIKESDSVDIKEVIKHVYSKGTVEQIMWGRDMAIQQLNDLGIQFGEEVVRCKNCENRCTDNCPMYFEEWVDYDDGDYLERDIIYHDNTKDDWFCPMRKRMEWDD